MTMETKTPLSVTHIITTLNTGGAEMMLYRVVKQIDQKKYPCRVISLTDEGPIGEKIEALGIPVISLGMKPGQISLGGFNQLIREIRTNKPKIIQTWMYHADFLGGLTSLFVPGTKLIWGIHNSTLDLGKSKRSTRLIVKVNAILSGILPNKIIVCSRAAQRIHKQIGFASDRMVFIPNGFDPTEFKPSSSTRQIIRSELNLSESTPVIGIAARFDPQKDHKVFFDAASILFKKIPNLNLILCGDGINWGNEQLVSLIGKEIDKDHVHLLGRRNDMPAVYTACDITILTSSFGEAFPLVIGESMSCGIPCVGTDVGDTSDLIGETGLVVPPGNPVSLAAAALSLLELNPKKRSEMVRNARNRIETNYDISKIAGLYSSVWEEVAGRLITKWGQSI